MIVFAAATMTAGIVIALTLYAVFTKTDFTTCGGILAVLGGVFLVFMIFSFFFGPTFHLIMSFVGVLLFGIYLVFDTQYIVGGKHRRHTIDKDDYILGAVMLYLDIITIFIYLLDILRSFSHN